MHTVVYNRNLINEYLSKTCVPPAIFKPSFTPFSPPPQLELAYKHPRLLMATPDDEESIYTETNREIEIKYVDDNSIEMLDASNGNSSSSNKAKSILGHQSSRKTAFLSINLDVSNGNNTTTSNSCKLIGKVNPNLVKTWEQLNGNCNGNGTNEVAPTANKHYHINRVIHTESSEDFYDSIDDDQSTSELDHMSSICHDSTENMEQAAGEIMAQCESLDKRKICWSIDSDK